MFKIFSIFMLLVMFKKLYNITFIKQLNDGYYIYYEVKEFNAWFKFYSTRIKKICIWKFKSSSSDDDLIY